MHRGGTSVATHLIARLGATLPADPRPPASDNPEGSGEPAGLVRLHDQLLFAADSAWHDSRPLNLDTLSAEARRAFADQLRDALVTSFGASPCFVLKDPRLCRMVPFYRRLLAEMAVQPKVILALREPAEVAASLEARHQLSADYAGFLWARHHLEAERETRDLPRVAVHYDEIMGDWRAPAGRIAELLRAELAGAALPEAMPHLQPGLRHHTTRTYGMFGEPLAELLRELHHTLARLDVTPPSVTATTLDRLSHDLSRASGMLEDALTVERCFQRLTTPHEPATAPDPLLERKQLSAALGRVHKRRWAEAPGRRGWQR